MEFFRFWADGLRDSQGEGLNFRTLEQAKSQITLKDEQEWVEDDGTWTLRNSVTGRLYNAEITRETIEQE